MVEQNGGKFRRLKKILKTLRFVGVKKFLRGTSLLDVQIWMEKLKKIRYGHFKRELWFRTGSPLSEFPGCLIRRTVTRGMYLNKVVQSWGDERM